MPGRHAPDAYVVFGAEFSPFAACMRPLIRLAPPVCRRFLNNYNLPHGEPLLLINVRVTAPAPSVRANRAPRGTRFCYRQTHRHIFR
jgi:hypothetical protein